MGNRAVITTIRTADPQTSNELGVYLHINGDPEHVTAFLEYCRAKEIQPPNDDYGWARLCQVIGNYFGGRLSVGIDKCCNLDCDNGDNGVYIIDGWDIVGRKCISEEQGENWHVDITMLGTIMNEIDIRQPTHLGAMRINVAVNDYVRRNLKLDYSKIVSSLRLCSGEDFDCNGCCMTSDDVYCADKLKTMAANAIEKLMSRVEELEAQND